MHEAGVEGVHFLSSLRDLIGLLDMLPSHKWLGYFQEFPNVAKFGART
jgi:hypothetical protein